MHAYDLIIRKYLNEVIDAAKAEIQGFADALEAWLGEPWDHMPRDGWREDLDSFVEHWTAQGIVAEPDDIRDTRRRAKRRSSTCCLSWPPAWTSSWPPTRPSGCSRPCGS
jgi:hypothetical protein